MPLIVRTECWPAEVTMDQPFVVDVSVRTAVAGVLVFRFELDENQPYVLSHETSASKWVECRRLFDLPAEYTTRFVLQLSVQPPAEGPPVLRVSATGDDGPSNVVLLRMNVV